LVRVSAGADASGSVAAELAVTVVPCALAPVTVPVATTEPASTSAWVSVYGAVQVVEPPGASVFVGQLTLSEGPAGGARVAAVLRPVRLTFPVLVTRNDQVTAWPAVPAEAGSTEVASATAGLWVVVTVALEGLDGRGRFRTPVPVVTAVLVMLPLSRSAWVTV
jgi:hypothetical protein